MTVVEMLKATGQKMKMNKGGMAELVVEQEKGLFLMRLIRTLYITYSDVLFTGNE